MKKLSIPHPSKKVLLIAAAIVVVVAVFAYGAVRAEQFSIVTKQEQAHATAVQAAKNAAVAKQIADLQAVNTSLKANVNASCVYLNSMVQDKHTKGYITVPTASGCPALKQ